MNTRTEQTFLWYVIARHSSTGLHWEITNNEDAHAFPGYGPYNTREEAKERFDLIGNSILVHKAKQAEKKRERAQAT